jgi:hypothetical protein
MSLTCRFLCVGIAVYFSSRVALPLRAGVGAVNPKTPRRVRPIFEFVEEPHAVLLVVAQLCHIELLCVACWRWRKGRLTLSQGCQQ